VSRFVPEVGWVWGRQADADDEINLNDVMVPTEDVHPGRRAHAKEDKHLDEDELQRRTEHERQLVERDRSE
jgi:hypothetical protein